MTLEIKVPSPGESITQVRLAKWLVSNGDIVEKDQEIVEIDSDKASFPIASPEAGRIKILQQEGDTVAVGAIIATIEPGKETGLQNTQVLPLSGDNVSGEPAPHTTKFPASPLARKIMDDKNIDNATLAKVFPGKKITRKDIETYINQRKAETPLNHQPGTREVERKKLSTLRLKLAERLVSVKNQTAMLTTFNEINMSSVMGIKEKYTEKFKERYGTGIGFMSFFTKAVTMALQEYPQVNSLIDGEELVTPKFIDIGIAVSAPKGLMVPVLRNAESLSLAELELKIRALAAKARDNKITIDDMKGGTFTITNGGVFGSLMSTPILNPPQSAILGMHKILDRPVALNGKVVIAPMMYVALSYDHRVIDGRESVGFLIKVKELLEEPSRMLTLGLDPVKLLLDL